MKANTVSIGRVAVVTFGHLTGKLVVILDIVDTSRALVEGIDVPRHVLPIRRMSMTKFHVTIPHSCNSATLRRALETAKVKENWEKTSWFRKLEARKKRQAMNDFDRFKKAYAAKKISGRVTRFYNHELKSLAKKK